MDVNMNRMFSVSSNVSLDPGLVCDENFKNHGYFEGRDSGTTRDQSPSETGQCNCPCQAVAPPSWR